MESAVSTTMDQGELPVSKLIWSMCLLVLSTWILNRVGSSLLLNVARRGDISYWPSLLVRQTLLIGMTVLSAQLVVVLYFYRPLKVFFTLPGGGGTEKRPLRALVIGIGGGACAFIVSIPFLLSEDPIHIIAHDLFSWPLSPFLVCQVILLVVVLPILTELVFCGVVFRSMRDASSLWPAAIGSSLLFACVWPVPDTFVTIILGVASALVFQKTRMLVSSMLTNATLAILTGTFLVCRDLHFF